MVWCGTHTPQMEGPHDIINLEPQDKGPEPPSLPGHAMCQPIGFSPQCLAQNCYYQPPSPHPLFPPTLEERKKQLQLQSSEVFSSRVIFLQEFQRRTTEILMLKVVEGGLTGLVSGSVGWARPCDSCRSTPCLVYCRADAAYLCAGCDGRVHAANHVASRHVRVWVCEACEVAPAVTTCKADAAVLCAACDADIHSANPLARRHHRVPILPVSSEEVAAGCRMSGAPFSVNKTEGEGADEDVDAGEGEAASWLLPNPTVNKDTNQDDDNNYYGFLNDGEIGEYLDLGYYNSCGDNQNQEQLRSHQHQKNHEKHEGSDGIVPARFIGGNDLNQQQHKEEENFHLEMEYEAPKAEFGYTTDSISHCVSLSSMDASVVPDTTNIDIANSHGRPSKGTIDLFSGVPYQIQSQFIPMDREARVHRYREKRKMRKFEKTIRYASRKAYAETRPRIKGRFAKRSDVEVEVDQLFSAAISTDGSYTYGLVPSF